MTAVFGDIQPDDDRTHAPGPESNYNESMYFNFFDQGRGQGGFVRIGNRPNEGYAEVTLCLYRPDGSALFMYQRPRIDGNDAFDAAGMRFETVEPLVRLRTTYDGGAVHLREPAQLADPGTAFRENPHKHVQLDIAHEAAGPVYGSTGAGREIADPEKEFARAHYEQHMRTTGTIAIDGETLDIDGFGLRDHSWGPRYWQAIAYYRWLTCAFGPDLGIMVSEICRDGTTRNLNGVVVRGEGIERITSVDIETTFVPGTKYHRALTARLATEGGAPLVLQGAVKGFVPLRNRRAGMVTHIGEGMTEYRLGDRVGLGISEYLDQIE